MSGITRFFLASSLVILASATLNISAATVSGIAPRECRFSDGYPAYPPKICTRHVLEHDNQSEMDYCAYLAFSKANRKLNSVYSRVMAKGHHSFLVTAELEWLKYRDKFCRVEVHQVCGGSMEPMVKYNCLADLTKEQTKNIKSTYWFIFRSDPAHWHHRNGSKGTLDKNAVKSYVLHETADLGPGNKGQVYSCLKIYPYKKVLNSMVSFSWTGHILNTSVVPYRKVDNKLYFPVKDYGWGNSGEGIIIVHKHYMIEKLELGKKGKLGAYDADEYGTYRLVSGSCLIK